MNADTPKMETDPNLAAEQAAAQKSLIDNLQNQAQLDTANIMARYGTRLALSSGGVTSPAAPGVPAAPAVPSIFGKAV